MTKNSTPTAFDGDRQDRLVAAAATVLVSAGGLLSLLLFGSIAAHALT